MNSSWCVYIFGFIYKPLHGNTDASVKASPAHKLSTRIVWGGWASKKARVMRLASEEPQHWTYIRRQERQARYHAQPHHLPVIAHHVVVWTHMDAVGRLLSKTSVFVRCHQ